MPSGSNSRSAMNSATAGRSPGRPARPAGRSRCRTATPRPAGRAAEPGTAQPSTRPAPGSSAPRGHLSARKQPLHARQREVGRESVSAREVSRSNTVIGRVAGTTSSTSLAGVRHDRRLRQFGQPFVTGSVERDPAVLDQHHDEAAVMGLVIDAMRKMDSLVIGRPQHWLSRRPPPRPGHPGPPGPPLLARAVADVPARMSLRSAMDPPQFYIKLRCKSAAQAAGSGTQGQGRRTGPQGPESNRGSPG